jgi:hypothetical protein
MRFRLVLPLLLLGAGPVSAQWSARDSVRDDRSFTFYDHGPYRAGIPRPESILGYAVGDVNTQFASQEKTLLAIAAAASDRVKVEEIGQTNERRTMRLYLISAPENIARLDAIRADMAKLADPRGVAPAELEAIEQRTPAVMWINESVHGNEAPGFEAAMQTLYNFAATQDPATLEAMKKVLIVLNPSTNPDGHERFVVWYNSINVANPDPDASEHDEPWSIQGRFNHYRFDMNRDVMTTTQREPRALVRGLLRWPPQVAIDQHGHVASYFFPPTSEAFNPHLGDNFRKWMEIYGKGNAAAFDAHGWMYYSRDVFDFFGPFYWDTWPSLAGAIGMTYETDGGGWRGLLYRRPDGTLLSNRDGIAKHYTTAYATFMTTATNKDARLKDYVAFRQRAVSEGRTLAMKRVVLVPGNDPVRAAQLASTLLRSGIEVERLSAPLASPRAHAYSDDGVSAQRFPAGSYVIDLAQPQGIMARSFLEPRSPFDSAFVRVELGKLARNERRGSDAQRESYDFYDVTAWSLPVIFGVQAYWTEDAAPLTSKMLVAPGPDAPIGTPDTASIPADLPGLAETEATIASGPNRTAGRLEGTATPIDVGGGVVGGARAQSAYFFSPEPNGSARLAYHLLAEGFRVGVIADSMSVAGKLWPRGTYIVRTARNDSTLHTRIDRLAKQSGVPVVASATAFGDIGSQFGPGSEEIANLVLPRIAILGDEGVSQTAYGALWWSLDKRYGISFTPIYAPVLSGGDLSKYNVIIMPDGYAGLLSGRIGKDGVDHLKTWVRAGGTLITMGGSTAWAARDDVDLTSARLLKADTTAAPPKGDSSKTVTIKSIKVAPKAEAPATAHGADDLLAVTSPTGTTSLLAPLPGSHFDVVLDRTSWLTYGYTSPRLTVMLDGDRVYSLSKRGTNAGIFAPTGPLARAGWVFTGNTERLLRGSAFLIHEQLGDGNVVLFANEPMFRGWWSSLDHLVLNAILLGPAKN